MDVQHLMKALKDNRKIKDLNMSELPFGKDMDIKPFTLFLRKNTNLMHLNLSGIFQDAF